MTRMTGPDCVVMCNLINTHTHTLPPWEDQCEWHRMTKMTGPDCAVMCNLINTHTHTLLRAPRMSRVSVQEVIAESGRGEEPVSKHQIRSKDGRWAGRRGVRRLNPRRETQIQGKNGDREREMREKVEMATV